MARHRTSRTAPPLYRAAEAADLRLTRVCRDVTSGRRDRWTYTAADLLNSPRLREALRRKFAADEAWLAHMRQSRQGGAR